MIHFEKWRNQRWKYKKLTKDQKRSALQLEQEVMIATNYAKQEKNGMSVFKSQREEIKRGNKESNELRLYKQRIEEGTKDGCG